MPTEDTTSAPAGANWVESVVAGGDELAVAMAIHGILVAPREAVEALARELGWWWRDPHSRWSIQPDSGGFCVVDWDKPSPCPEWPLPTPEALLLLHLARLGPTRERCKDCEGQRLQWQWEDGGPWTPKDSKRYAAPDSVHFAARRCPTCTGPAETPVTWEEDGHTLCKQCEDIPFGDCTCMIPGKPTGWVTRERGWAERWLRARGFECDYCTNGLVARGYGDVGDCEACGGRPQGPGDPEARADLWVLADQLLDQGDPLGDWLALWLAGNPCEDCNRAGRTVAATYETLAGVQAVMTPGNSLEVVGCTSEGGEPFTTKRGGTIIEWAPCSPCHRTGLELGHHTQAMAARGAA